MHLVLDFGNTMKKLALFDKGELMVLERYHDITEEILQRFLEDHQGITVCILSSVIAHPPGISSFLHRHTRFIELDKDTPIPIQNIYLTKETLGKDRLAAAVAGAAMFPNECVLVINAGTALTFDFVNDHGEYLGGSISPGMEMRFRALHTFTGKLPLLTYREEATLIGSDTNTSIISGVVNGIIAEIEGVAGQYLAQFPGLKVILSGGDMEYLVNRLKISIFAHPNIVIYGLHQILNFNVNKAL